MTSRVRFAHRQLQWICVVGGVLGTLLPARSAGAQQLDSVTVEQRMLMTPDPTPADARRRAIDNAPAEAVRRVAGVRVQSGALSLTEERGGGIESAYVSVVQLDAAGRAVDYRVVRDEWETIRHPQLGSQLYYHVEVLVFVAPERGTLDASFAVEVAVDPPVAAVRSDHVARNAELIARITSTHAARGYVFSVADDSVERLAPNDYAPAIDLPAGRAVEFPSADWRERGLRLRASLPPGRAERRELLVVVAATGPVPPPPGRGTVLDLQRWLVSIPLDRRAIGFGAYLVRRF
jgi:hypothetical protein